MMSINAPGLPAVVTITVKVEQVSGFSVLVSPIQPGQPKIVTIRFEVSKDTGQVVVVLPIEIV